MALLSGPDFWGRLNPKWSLCSRGRRQSPIDINPKLLLFDPNLSPLQVYGDYVSKCLMFAIDSNLSYSLHSLLLSIRTLQTVNDTLFQLFMSVQLMTEMIPSIIYRICLTNLLLNKLKPININICLLFVSVLSRLILTLF